MSNPPEIARQHFVMIFRQGARQLSEAELKARAAETRVWAQQHNSAGHRLEPHILAPEGQLIGADAGTQADALSMQEAARAITAILFLEARDFAQALEVAKAHPAIHYGSVVELRAWSPPAPAT